MRQLLCFTIFAVFAAVCRAGEPSPAAARSADSFVDSIGLNGLGGPYLFHYRGERRTLYGTLPVDARYVMGVRHARYEIRPNMDVEPISNLYKDQGVRIDALISWIWSDPRINKSGNIADALDELKKFPPGSIATIEGNNEADMPQESGDFPRYKSSMAGAIVNQEALFKAVKADPRFNQTPVIAFTLGKNWPWGGRIGYGKFTTTAFDYESVHSYTAGDTIGGSLRAPGHNEWLKIAHSILPPGAADKPIVVTETGFVHTSVDKKKVKHNSEVAQAKQEMMLFAQNFSEGFVRTFVYSVGGESNWEMDTHDDGSPMPAGRALAFLTSTLGDAHWDRERLTWVASPVNPASIDYELHGAPTSVHTLLLQKADGSFYLLAWNDVLVWDGKLNQDIHNEPAAVELSIGGSISHATLSTMSDDGQYATTNAAIQFSKGRSNISMAVPDSLMLVHLFPANQRQ